MRAVLRGYQQRIKADVRERWQAGARCVMVSMATGGGKTVTAMSLAGELDGVVKVQAHRSELVGQLSIALAREGIRHDLVCSSATRRQIVDAHMDELGRSYYDPAARYSVESVDTAIRRKKSAPNVNYVMTDEGHHVLAENKWGRALLMHEDARSVLWTATPYRSDGKGLAAHADGLVNALVVGPGSADLMAQGHLVEYDVLTATASDLNLEGVSVGSNGEFNQQQVARAVHASTRIVGDAAEHYTSYAMGKLCIVFAVDVAHARELHAAYTARGVVAELVTGADLDTVRAGALKRFRARSTTVLINVDLFGEGTDVPGVEVVQMCRPTASFSLECQQVGRALRLDVDPALMHMWDNFDAATRRAYIAASRKPRALIIDHVGNVAHREYSIGEAIYKGPPEGFTDWHAGLERRGSRRSGGGGAIPQRTCLGCYVPYERIYAACPWCGTPAPEPEQRATVAQVDGSLQWLDPAALAELRARVAVVDGPPLLPQSLSAEAHRGAVARWYERQREQHALREAIAYWAGRHAGHTDDMLHRKFYLLFGVDVVSALALGASDAAKLRERIDATT